MFSDYSCKKLVIRYQLCRDAQQELETASQVSKPCGLVLGFVNCKEDKPIWQLSVVMCESDMEKDLTLET